MTIAQDLTPDVELRLLGRVAGDSVRRLGLALDEVVALHPEHLIVNLHRCTGLEPSVAAVLARTQAALEEVGGTLVLRGPSPEVIRALMRTDLLRRVEIDLPGTATEGRSR